MRGWNRALQFYTSQGLGLVAVFDLNQLSAAIIDPIQSAGVNITNFSRLVVTANSGGVIWEKMHAQRVDIKSKDPMDHFAIETTAVGLLDYVKLKRDDFFFLYPFLAENGHPTRQNAAPPPLIPLQQLGKLANWGFPSPIGNSIHPTFGLWTAFRTAVLVKADLPLQIEPKSHHPCDSCLDKPCISACPAGAVGDIGRFDIDACATHRISDGSTCEARCLARLACPIGADYRYSAEQLSYHYRHSLPSMRRWINGKG